MGHRWGGLPARVGSGAARRAGAPPSTEDSDEWWVGQVAAGNGAQALRVLYQRYERPAFSLARRVCRDDGLAQEAVQDAFVEAWRDAARFDRNRGTVAGWLLMLVHHRSVDAVRREQPVRLRTAALDLVHGEHRHSWVPPADDQVIRRADARWVREALRRLPAAQRRVLELCFYESLTHAEAAEHLRIPLGTVKSRLYGGVHRMREWLDR